MKHTTSGSGNELENLEIARIICQLLYEMVPARRLSHGLKSYQELIHFVSDRPGHDYRYAVDTGKLHKELGWQPQKNFLVGISQTVSWYLKNETQHYYSCVPTDFY